METPAITRRLKAADPTIVEAPSSPGHSPRLEAVSITLSKISGALEPRAMRVRLATVGVKKINDMGVFAITATSSIWAYVWLFIVLIDSEVQLWEAWLTLAFFFVLIIMAFGADKYKASKDKLLEKDDEKNGIAIDFSAMEIFRELVNEKQGNAANDKQSVEKRERMKKILKDTMNTDKIDNVNFE